MSMPSNNIQNWMRRIDHVHFVGIGGVGMGGIAEVMVHLGYSCLLYTSPSPRDGLLSRMPSSA